MVAGGMKCVKYLLFVFNFIFFVAGLALIIAGAVVQAQLLEDSEYAKLVGNFKSVAIILIVIGCIIFIIGFFGCCGAIKENYCMVMTFAVLLGLVFLMEIGVGIAGFAMRGKADELIKTELKKTKDKYKTDAGVKKFWDHMQKKMDCCGIESKADWKDSIPGSCCGKDNVTCASADVPATKIGCYKAVTTWVKENILIVAGVGIGLAFIQIVGVILACCLARSIKAEYEVV